MENTLINTDKFLIVEKDGEYFMYAKKVDPFGTKYLAPRGSIKEQSEMDEISSLILTLLKEVDSK